ncbi:MAG: exosome complex protein Rrp42 [Candidatus Micrarchaeota archaeon]
MAEELKDLIMTQIKRDAIQSMLKKGQRLDQRGFDEYRKIEVQKNAIPNAEGSALTKLGNTQVLVGAKFDVVTPFPDRPKEGVMVSNADLLPLAHGSFEPGPPNEDAIELARVVDRGIRSSNNIDLKSFFITEGKVLSLYLDMYVLDYSGNYTDAASISAMSALTCARMPKIENNVIVRGEYTGLLKLTSHPVTTSFVKIGETWLVDPTADEERVADTKITIATTKDHVCAIQKGPGKLTKQELMDNIEVAFKRGNDLRKIILQ